MRLRERDLRLSERARFTRDVPIDWQVAEEELLEALIPAAALETEDYFTFQVERRSSSLGRPSRYGRRRVDQGGIDSSLRKRCSSS
jgi:hypothetical protein